VKGKSEIKNVAASVRERLRNIASQTSKEFQSVVRQYVQERFLFRLSKSVDKFKLDKQLQMLWLAFLERSKLVSVNTFLEVVTKIQSFIEPIFDEKTRNNWNPKNWEWE